MVMWLAVEVDLTAGQRDELRALMTSSEVSAAVGARARIVLWHAEGRMKRDITVLAGVSRPTVDLWLGRYADGGAAGLLAQQPGGPREQVSPDVRSRVLALTRATRPAETGLSHWSTRTMADYVTRVDNTPVSHHWVANLWREHGLKPQKQGTFKLSKDPAFADKVADIVGLYLDPPGGAVVLSLDEKTQIQALDRTQPLLPIEFDRSEQRTHDYVRHGTTNLFAALNVGTGEVIGDCVPSRNNAAFLAFLKKAHPRRARQRVHPHHTRRQSLARRPPERAFPLHPDRIVLAEPDRDLVQHHHPPGHPPRHLRLRANPHPHDPRLHHLLEHQPTTVHLDRNRQRDPRQVPNHPTQHQETRREQQQVNRSASRCN
jgi:transposase